MSTDVAHAIVELAETYHAQDVRDNLNTIKLKVDVSMNDDETVIIGRPEFTCSTWCDHNKYIMNITYYKESVGGHLGDLKSERWRITSSFVFPSKTFPEVAMKDACKSQFTEFLCDVNDMIWEARECVLDENAFDFDINMFHIISKGNTEIFPGEGGSDGENNWINGASIKERFQEFGCWYTNEVYCPQVSEDEVRLGLKHLKIIDDSFNVFWRLVKRQMFLRSYVIAEVPSEMTSEPMDDDNDNEDDEDYNEDEDDDEEDEDDEEVEG